MYVTVDKFVKLLYFSPREKNFNFNSMGLYFILLYLLFFVLLSKDAIQSIEDGNSRMFLVYSKWETQKNIIVKVAVTREDRAGSEFKENHPSFFSGPRSSSRSKHRVFFSRCAGSNYFSGPHSHGRLTLSSCRGSSFALSREERKCKGDSG